MGVVCYPLMLPWPMSSVPGGQSWYTPAVLLSRLTLALLVARLDGGFWSQ